MKKILLIIGMILMSFVSVNSATTINSCLGASATNDTEYILSPNFNIDLSPCFSFSNKQNIILDGNNTYLNGDVLFNINSNNNVVIKNFYVKNMYFGNTNSMFFANTNVTIQDNVITDLSHNFIENVMTGFPQVIWSNYYLTIKDNYIKTNGNQFVLITGGGDGTVGGHYALSDYYNTTITGNEFVGFGNMFVASQGSPSAWRLEFWENFVMNNNILVGASSVFNSNVAMDSCTGKSFTGNYDSSLDITDTNGDFLSDGNILYSVGSCATLFNGVMPTKINSDYLTDTIYISKPLLTPNQYESSTRYIIGDTGRILNATNYYNFQSVQNSIIDISLWELQNVFDIRSVNVLRMGNDNTLYGGLDLTNKPVIITTSMPTITYTYGDPYGTNWNMISYDTRLEINNVNFQLNSVGNYGLIRKSGTLTGDFLTIIDSRIEYNHVPSNTATPTIFSGAFTNVYNSIFDIGQIPTQIVFRGGQSGDVSGGHLIYNNEFIGGGLIFQEFLATGTEYGNKFIHNKFEKTASVYSYPFNLTANSLFTQLDMNGTYYYKVGCDSYPFNVGNYYRDIDDNVSKCADANLDGLCDDNPHIRGILFGGGNITDYRTLFSYPYNFASHTGEVVPVDLCGSFSWNINSPVAVNYTSNIINTDWEFISANYNNMICVETINGETAIYENVSSGENQGMAWEFGSGSATHQVICCDNGNCDNVVQESPVTEFCIDTCVGVAPIIAITPPTIITGCTDPIALNYNPTATQDDGSCSYTPGTGGSGSGSTNIILSSDSSATGDNAVAFIGDLVNGAIGMITPVGIFIFVLLIIISIFVFLGA